jgi:hypothetical protein
MVANSWPAEGSTRCGQRMIMSSPPGSHAAHFEPIGPCGSVMTTMAFMTAYRLGLALILPAGSGRPSFRKIAIAGQKLVKADWNRLAPTKAVKRKKPGWTQ